MHFQWGCLEIPSGTKAHQFGVAILAGLKPRPNKARFVEHSNP
jgi:hypothetical protein